jgi:hypothetical protein
MFVKNVIKQSVYWYVKVNIFNVWNKGLNGCSRIRSCHDSYGVLLQLKYFPTFWRVSPEYTYSITEEKQAYYGYIKRVHGSNYIASTAHFGIIKSICVFHSTHLPWPSTSNFVFVILQTIMALGLILQEIHILLLSSLMKIYADDAETLH